MSEASNKDWSGVEYARLLAEERRQDNLNRVREENLQLKNDLKEKKSTI